MSQEPLRSKAIASVMCINQFQQGQKGERLIYTNCFPLTIYNKLDELSMEIIKAAIGKEGKNHLENR